MEKIFNKFNELCQSQSDINEHLPTLSFLSSECNHVTELGVRTVISTWALASGNPKVLRSYDIQHPDKVGGAENFKQLLEAIKETEIDFVFTEADDLKIQIEETDFLFIDTLHVYEHLKKELELHGNKSRKYIAFHDTITFGEKGENGEIGLIPAINEFLSENQNWYIHHHYQNNNGLMVLKRKN